MTNHEIDDHAPPPPWQIMWLMGWPAGFKLNSNLAQTLGATIMGGLRIWNACILWVWAALTSGPAFRAFAMCGGLGISFVVALSADALALATIHVWVIYNVGGCWVGFVGVVGGVVCVCVCFFFGGGGMACRRNVRMVKTYLLPPPPQHTLSRS